MDNRTLHPQPKQEGNVVPMNMGSPFLVIPNCLPPEFLTEVIAYAEQFCEKETGKVGMQDPNATPEEQEANNLREKIRSCDISWIKPMDERSQIIHQQIDMLLVDAGRNYFGFDIWQGGTEAIQYTEYTFHEEKEVKDHYGWHMDSAIVTPNQSDRKLSYTIQLSHHSDYTGCDFEFPNSYEDDSGWDADLVKQKGTAIIFPSFMHHRVTPITGGHRKALVGWGRGPKFR